MMGTAIAEGPNVRCQAIRKVQRETLAKRGATLHTE
jgi:hypothetical protein